MKHLKQCLTCERWIPYDGHNMCFACRREAEAHARNLTTIVSQSRLNATTEMKTPMKTNESRVLLEGNQSKPVDIIFVGEVAVVAKVKRPTTEMFSHIALQRGQDKKTWAITQVNGPWTGFEIPPGLDRDGGLTDENNDGALESHYIRTTNEGFYSELAEALEWALFLKIALEGGQRLDWWPNAIRI